MVSLLREIQGFSADDWIWLFLLVGIFFAGIGIIVFIVMRGLKQLKLYVGKDGIKINEAAHTKLDDVIVRLKKWSVI